MAADEGHRIIGRHYDQAARNAREASPGRTGQGKALLASFLLASPPLKTSRGVKLADSTLDVVPLCRREGRCEDQ